MSLFHQQLAFAPIDPLADGLGDDIAAEQSEEGHFELLEQLDEHLADQWENILSEARNDPDVTFVREE